MGGCTTAYTMSIPIRKCSTDFTFCNLRCLGMYTKKKSGFCQSIRNKPDGTKLFPFNDACSEVYDTGGCNSPES